MESIIAFIGGLIPLTIFCLIFYFIVRKSHEGSSGVRHAYYYFVSFLTLAVLYWAVADFIRIIWANNSSVASQYYYNDSDRYLRSIAGRLSAIIISLPVYAFHWMKATPPDGEIDVLSRKTYALGIVICSIVIMLVSWSFLFYYLITWALGVAEPGYSQTVPGLVSYSVPATLIWILHFNIWRKLNDKHDDLTKNN